MKILFLSDKVPWPADNGGAFTTLGMIKGLRKKNHDLTILSLNSDKHFSEPEKIPAGIKSLAEFITVDINTRVNTCKLLVNLLFSKKPYNIERFRSDIFPARLKKLVCTNSYDIIQFEGLPVTMYYDIARKYSKATLIYRAHNVECEIWRGLSVEPGSVIRSVYYKILSGRIAAYEATIIEKFEGVISISDDDLNCFNKIANLKNSIVIYPTINETDIQPRLKQTDKELTFLGSLDCIPNISAITWFLKPVWPINKSADSEITLTIAGRNPDRKLVKLIKKSGAEYAGTPADSAEYISNADLFIVPLFSGSGLRIKIIEALSYGIPVVTTKKGAAGLPIRIVKEIKLADDPSVMAGHIIDTLSAGPDTSNKVQDIKKAVRSIFGNLAQTDKLIDFYSQVSDDN